MAKYLERRSSSSKNDYLIVEGFENETNSTMWIESDVFIDWRWKVWFSREQLKEIYFHQSDGEY